MNLFVKNFPDYVSPEAVVVSVDACQSFLDGSIDPTPWLDDPEKI